MYRVLAKEVFAGGSLAVEGRADGFGHILASESSAYGRVSGVQNDRGDLIYTYQSVCAVREASWSFTYLQHILPQLVRSMRWGCSSRAIIGMRKSW